MKRIVLYFSVVLMFFSCDNSDVKTVHCFDGLDTFVLSSTDTEGIIRIPNIILNDCPAYGLYAVQLKDSVGHGVIPLALKLEVFDGDNNLIYKNDEVSIASSFHGMTYLWDGVIDEVPYNGIVSVKIFVQINSEITLNASGRVQVLSSDYLRDCGMNNSDCELAECRYYGQFIDQTSGIGFSTLCG